MNIKIKKRYNSNVLYESEKETLKEVVVEAVSKNTDLSGADLSGADLNGTYLGGADLRDADLRDADFYKTLFYGREGETKIKESQIEAFHAALGIVVEKDINKHK